ncbi:MULTISPECIES: AMP-binding protein [unclassified Minwuia]|jgi:phenylacetate-coenzyme A ligase PaaK-like adenylate-forming protein|uniref:phenylacetate--CoA ligase family protein n=1 Tax=unclassified Minwuia TaxID=2618799 RepID=UPI00247AF2C6|nr:MULTISPECIES: AMP-binding protein [unclassified Minwuia]
MAEHFDELETRDPEQRETELMAALPGQVALAKTNSSFFGKLYADIDPMAITSREALQQLPVIRKPDVQDAQNAEPPFGGLNAVPVGDMAHVYMSPGPIFEPDGVQRDHWRYARALYAAGFRRGDIVHNTLSYHLTPAGMLVETGCRAIGCAVFPGGVGNTEMQVDAIERLKPTAYAGTPSFLRILLEKADEMGRDSSSYRKASVGAEPLPPSLRQWFEDRGIQTTQGYGTADVGLIAYESLPVEGMLLDEGLILEICRPGTGEPVAEGEVGEIVVTTFNPIYPLIRYGTGDMTAILPGTSPCGRTATRIKGWMGRADQSCKVRGMFVHAKLVGEIVGRHAEVTKARFVITNPDNRDQMTLMVEAEKGDATLLDAVKQSVTTVTKLRGEVEIVAPGSLPNDGIVVEDARTFD